MNQYQSKEGLTSSWGWKLDGYNIPTMPTWKMILWSIFKRGWSIIKFEDGWILWKK